MIEYIKAKKAAKAQQKEIENRLEADARENERMGKLLSKYGCISTKYAYIYNYNCACNILYLLR